jgi:hypothetical protein
MHKTNLMDKTRNEKSLSFTANNERSIKKTE